MSYYYTIPMVDETELAEARKMLGVGLSRIIGYYEEDGAKSIAKIEQAFAAGDAAAMVIPAHTLKGESRQLGATRLGELAEAIEKTARQCVERHSLPNEVASEVAMLRGCFMETLTALKPNPGGGKRMIDLQSTSAPAYSPATPRPTPFASGPRTFGRRIG